MRKIETLMNTAITASGNMKLDNTQVVTMLDTMLDGFVSTVYLHGNCIAMVGDTWLRLFDGGWQSKTTKSRLNAILAAHGNGGERVIQRGGVWFLQNRDGSTIPFVSGMLLD